MHHQKGVALYLSLAILAILLGIALGVAALTLGQLKVVQTIGFSTVAFYAADTGIERELLDKNYETQPAGYSYACFMDLDDPSQSVDCNDLTPQACPDNFAAHSGSDACTQVTVVELSGPTKIKSVGYYREVRRALEISF